MKKIVLCLSLLSLIMLSCSMQPMIIKAGPGDINFFFETCYYFPETQANIIESDVKKAAALFEDAVLSSKVDILDREIQRKKACYFTDRQITAEGGSVQSADSAIRYILSAYFVRGNSTIYRVKDGRTLVVFDQKTILDKIGPAGHMTEGTVFSGCGSRFFSFRRYLEEIIPSAVFGADGSGGFSLGIVKGDDNQYLKVPFLWDKFDFVRYSSLRPGDYSLGGDGMAQCSEKISMDIRQKGWEKRPVLFSARDDGPKVIFKSSVINTPFSPEALLKYFYSLKTGHTLTSSLSSFYSPVYSGSSIDIKVKLASVELLADKPEKMSPEGFFLWFYLFPEQPEEYPDEFYANLLSLKIAVKLFTGSPKYLGGGELINKGEMVPFDEIKKYILRYSATEFYGIPWSHFYFYSLDLFNESSATIGIGESLPFIAFYNTPQNADRCIASVVIRENTAFEKQAAIEKELAAEGFTVMQRLFESVAENDSWASVSAVIPASREQDFILLYEKKLKSLSPTASLGIYRITRKGQSAGK